LILSILKLVVSQASFYKFVLSRSGMSGLFYQFIFDTNTGITVYVIFLAVGSFPYVLHYCHLISKRVRKPVVWVNFTVMCLKFCQYILHIMHCSIFFIAYQ